MSINIYLAVLATLIFAAIIVRFIVWNRAEKLRVDYLKKFEIIKDLDVYEESKPSFHFGGEKIKKAVLLLHGFTCSTHEMISLVTGLEREGYTFYAPMLTGFGTGSFDKLYKIKASDWMRDSVCAYDMLASVAEEVSIVGQSTGSVLAAYIASVRKVKNLIYVGPNFYTSKRYVKQKRILQNTYIGKLVTWFLPVKSKPIQPGRVTFTDTLEPFAAQNILHYPSTTLVSILEMWKLQDSVNVLEAKYDTLSVLYGKHDITVDMSSFIEFLDKNHVTYDKYAFENTAHNVLEDYEKEKAVEIIISILNK